MSIGELFGAKVTCSGKNHPMYRKATPTPPKHAVPCPILGANYPTDLRRR